MRFKIYHKGETEAFIEVEKLTYSDEWMGEEFVTVSVSSETPVDWRIGDYIIYRGQEYTLSVIPATSKQARRNSVLGAFSYEGVKFRSCSDELTRCKFLDVVPKQNTAYYTGLTDFNFYCPDVNQLAERIQANLDRLYTENRWTVTVANAGSVKNKVVSVSNIYCWEALALVESEFDLNFVIRGRNIIIGDTGELLSRYFEYGKDKGLFKIERSTDDSQQVVTRLRAYGNTTNMPVRYYANVGLMCYIDLVEFTRTGTGQETDYMTLAVPADKASRMKFKNSINVESVNYTKYVFKVRLGKATGTVWFADNGNNESYINFTADSDAGTPSEMAALTAEYNRGERICYVLSNYDKDKWYTGWKVGDPDNRFPDNMNCRHLMLPGFPYKSLKEWADGKTLPEWDGKYSQDIYDPFIDSKNADALGIREATIFFDGSEDRDDIYPSIEWLKDGEGNALNVVKVGSTIEDDGVFDGNVSIPNFKITIADIGFNPMDYADGTPTISMKDGMCGGREFEIVGARKVSLGYELTLKRLPDSSLDLYFPYKDFQIRENDRFVLLNIEMPSVYVDAASEELLRQAKEWLAKNDYVVYKYSLSIDELFMQRQHDAHIANDEDSLHDTIKAGSVLHFEDADLDIVGAITIDKLEIKEGEGLLPQYSVTLSEDKTVGTLQRMQQQIDSVVVGGGGGGYNAAEIDTMIRNVGAKHFLSKVNDDIAKGKITFEKGLTSKEASTFEKDVRIEGTAYTKDIVNDNKITTKDLEVTGTAHFYEVVIDKARKTSAISFQSVASAKLDIVTHDDSIYHCFFLAKDEDDRQITNDFLVNDQILMMTFNVGVGVSYDVGNRYYWAKCSGVSSEPVTIDGKEYHWIDIDMSVRATNSNAVPQPEDEIVVLGHQSAAHTERQNTIIYASIDNSFLGLRRPDADENGNHPLLKAPMIVQLHGIDSFGIYYDNPNNYGNVISQGYNSLRGRLRSMTSSQDDVEVKVEDTSAQKVYYLCTETLSTPSAAAAGWSENCVPTDATPYIWKKTIKKYFDGTSEPFVEFVNKYQKGETGSPGTDGRDGIDGTDGKDGRDGKDGQGITFDGELWSEQLVADKGGLLPKLYAVRMYSKIYIVINPEGTANPPIWCYTDSEGNRLTYSDGGYVLALDDDGNLMENTDEWEEISQFGADGKDGRDGKDGYTPIKGIDYFDGYTPVKGVDYFDGKDGPQGVGVKYINVFRRGNVAQMDKPNDASCNFDNPIPKGWSDGVPAGSEKCWITTRPFYTDGRTTDWCKPVGLTDTADFDCCFSKDVERPSAPTSHGTQADAHWHNDPQEGDRWMATSVCRNGEWSKWQITQILGEEGKPAYLHTAYCNSITTWKDFTVENPNGQRYAYVGTYTDSKPEDSTDPTSYRWVFVKGSDGQNINARGEWKEGMTLKYMDSFTFEGVTYLYLGEDSWTGYPRSKYLDRDGNVLRYHDGGLVWVNDGMPCLFETDSLFEVLMEDGLSLVLVKGFDVAKINGKASQSIFTFADEQQALVEFRRGTNAVDNGATYSIALSGCKGITMTQAGSVCAVNISRSSTVNSTKVDGFDYYLPASDCQVTVNCSYRGKLLSIILPVQIDYSDRWSEFLQSDEQFKSEINALKVTQGDIWHVQTLFRQQVEEDLSGVHNELSQKYSKTEGKKNTEAINSLKQSIETTDGKVKELSQDLSQKYYSKDDVDGKITDASNELKQSIETTDGKIDTVKTELSSSIKENKAKIETSVQKAEDGKVTSDIILTSDYVTIDCKNFSVDKEGNVNITGTVNANEGQIAGLEIKGNGLTNEGFDNDAYIILRNDTNGGSFVGIGGNVLPASSGVTGVGKLQNHKYNETPGLTNYALLVSARNAYHNEAINISGGCISGFAMRNSVITSSKKLARNDYNVICVNTEDITVTLPFMEIYDDGHVVRIKNLSSKKITIKAANSKTWDGTSKRDSMPFMIYNRDTNVSGSTGMELESKGYSCEFVWVRDIQTTIGDETYYGAWVQYKFPRDW